MLFLMVTRADDDPDDNDDDDDDLDDDNQGRGGRSGEARRLNDGLAMLEEFGGEG